MNVFKILQEIKRFFRHADGVNTSPQTEFERNLHALIHQPRTAYGEEMSVPRTITEAMEEGRNNIRRIIREKCEQPGQVFPLLRCFFFGVFLGCAVWLTFLLVRAWDLPFKGDW